MGWYGYNCSQQCAGHCTDSSTCNHVTGQCDEGCAAGWTGSLCDKGKKNYFKQMHIRYQLKSILNCCVY